MLVHALRTALATLATLLSATLVEAQGQPQRQPQGQPQSQQQYVPAPDRHPATGLVFPAQVANVPKVRSVDYGKTFHKPGVGYSWGYQSGREFLATVYLYNLDIRGIPDGAASQQVVSQFQQALQDIRQAAAARKYDQLKVIRGPADCTAGSLTFRCITMSAMRDGRPLHTGLMLTAYRGYFLKLRLDWFDGAKFTQATVDRFVQTLIATIVR